MLLKCFMALNLFSYGHKLFRRSKINFKIIIVGDTFYIFSLFIFTFHVTFHVTSLFTSLFTFHSLQHLHSSNAILKVMTHFSQVYQWRFYSLLESNSSSEQLSFPESVVFISFSSNSVYWGSFSEHPVKTISFSSLEMSLSSSDNILPSLMTCLLIFLKSSDVDVTNKHVQK